MHTVCWAVLFCFWFWLCWVLISASEIQFPDQGSNSSPWHWERRVLDPGPKSPLKLGSWVKFSCWQDSLAQRIPEVLLSFCACSGIPGLQHSFWKLTELSATWKPKQTWFLSQTAFSWLRSRLKKKKKESSALSVVPPAWTQRCGMRGQTGSRELTQLPPGE